MKNRIREFREAADLSQEQLADRLGIHWQTVHRAETNKSTLSASKQAQYASALGTTVDQLFGTEAFRSVTVKHHVQAGHWAEAWELDPGDWYEVPVPNDVGLARISLHGAETRGPSMNRRYPEGSVLIYTDMIETGEDLQVGKRYIIERERSDGLREATVKALWRDESGALWLIPESTDPRFQEPIPLTGGQDDTIRVVGRVRYAVSRE